MGHEPDKKKPSFREKMREAFNGVSRRDWLRIFKDTANDLKRPKEIAVLVGCSFLPGGWIGYGIYRVAKYRHKKASNDNPDKPKEQRPPQPPQGPRP